jgi:hypothetical protein
MSKRPITDDLLKLAIESRIDAGVSAARIRILIEAFASHEWEGEQPEEIVGFLWVEDIPADRRGTFLTTLLALAEEPNGTVANARQSARRRPIAPVSLLTRARTVFGFATA